MTSLTPHLSSLAVLIGVAWGFYRLGRNMLHKDFVSRVEFDRFIKKQDGQNSAQNTAFLDTSKNLLALADEVHQMRVDIKWIIESQQRQERVLTGEHKRPGF